jgi:hypothetical protein
LTNVPKSSDTKSFITKATLPARSQPSIASCPFGPSARPDNAERCCRAGRRLGARKDRRPDPRAVRGVTPVQSGTFDSRDVRCQRKYCVQLQLSHSMESKRSSRWYCIRTVFAILKLSEQIVQSPTPTPTRRTGAFRRTEYPVSCLKRIPIQPKWMPLALGKTREPSRLDPTRAHSLHRTAPQAGNRRGHRPSTPTSLTTTRRTCDPEWIEQMTKQIAKQLVRRSNNINPPDARANYVANLMSSSTPSASSGRGGSNRETPPGSCKTHVTSTAALESIEEE